MFKLESQYIQRFIKIMQFGLKVALILSFLNLTACATLSPAECQTADWYRIGERDGSAGYYSRLDQHYKACQKVNIQPHQSLYIQGYNEGIRYYCQPQVILNASLIGKGNAQVCPAQSRASLDRIIYVGHAVYETERYHESLENRRAELVHLLEYTKLNVQDRLQLSEELNSVYAELRINEKERQAAHDQLDNIEREYKIRRQN